MCLRKMSLVVVFSFGLLSGLHSRTDAGDWNRFRGPNGSGVSTDTDPQSKAPPTEWSEQKNLRWKLELPGPGHSCPIVVGERVFVTCWTGYAMSRSQIGDQKDLKRNLICIDRKTGKILWSQSVPAVLPEEPYGSMFAEHGYASHTPVSDGERVYAFFGKSGVFAFDLDGKQLWHANVGTGDDPRSWGTASSPIIHKNMVIVPATVESNTLFAFDKLTGKEVWKQKADGFASTWGTPVVVDLPGGESELVMGVPYEIWGFNPENGKLRWFCETVDSDSMCSSVIAHDGIVYAIEGRSGGSVAVKAGGKDDVTKTHLVWSGLERGRIGTPVYHDGVLYWVSGGIANAMDAKTGKRIYQERLASAAGAGSGTPPTNNGQRGGAPEGGRRGGPGGFGGGGFGGGGFGGGRGGQDYSSPVVAGNNLYFITRGGTAYVVSLGREFKLLATNQFESDKSDFSASPAISNGELFIRSSKYLYCVAE